MTFHQFPYGDSFDSVFPGSYDERYQNLQFPQEYHRSLYAYPPDMSSALSQHFDLNHCNVSARNVPCSSFSGEPCYGLPYSHLTVLPNRYQSDPWANFTVGQTFIPTPVDSSSQYINNSINDYYSGQTCSSLPNPAYSMFLQQLDRKFLAHSSASPNQHHFSDCCPTQMQYYQCPVYPFQQKEIPNSGSGYCSSVPASYASYNYSIDEIMRNNVTSSAKLICGDSSLFGVQSSLQNGNDLQRPAVTQCPPPMQPCVPGLNVEADTIVDTFSKSSIVDYGSREICVSKSEAASCQCVTDISTLSGTRRMLTDCAVNEDGSSMMISSVSDETCVSHTDTVSATANQFLYQAVSEIRQSGEESVIFTQSSTEEKSACCGKSVTAPSIFPDQRLVDMSHAVIDSTSGCEMSVKEDERIGICEVETDTSCVALSDAVTVSSVTSTTMHPENWQLQADSSVKTQTVSSTNLAPAIQSEVNVANEPVRSSPELLPKVTETDKSHAKTHESLDVVSDASDDVIVLSPLLAHEPTVSVSTNPVTDATEAYCPRIQPTCVLEHPNIDRQLRSVLRPVVPKSVSVRFPRVSSLTLQAPRCQSSPSVPVTTRDFCKSNTCELLPVHDKHITNNHCSVQTTSCQRHLSCHATSRLDARHSSADASTRSSMKPMFFCPPVTVSCDSVRDTELNRLLHLTPSAMQDELSKRRACNPTVRDNIRCNLENSRHTGFQKPKILSPVSSLVVSQHRNMYHYGVSHVSRTSSSRTVNSASVSQFPHISARVRTDPKQNQCMNSKPHPLALHRRGNSSLQFQDISKRRNGTYSVRAASLLLQHLKRAKLPDFVSSHAARQQQLHVLNRRLSLPARTSISEVHDVIDLTDDDVSEENTSESCESIFARTRRRIARMPLLRRPRQNLFRRSTLADGSCCDPKRRPTKNVFAVDRSLPFYRCFVQKLLRNFKFSASGLPAKIYPEFPEILPSAVSGITSPNRGVHSPGYSCAYKELVKKRKPVVTLKKLDDSILNKFGTVNIDTSQSGVHVLSSSTRNESENYARHARSTPSDVSKKVQTLESRDKNDLSVPQNGSDIYPGQKIKQFDWTKSENIQKESMMAKRTANEQQHNELMSLCRPVSIVLERLDTTTIRQTCKELSEAGRYRQGNQRVAQQETDLSVDDLNWTVSEIPRVNKVPLLVIRLLTLPTQKTSQKKVAKKRNVLPARQLRSTSKYLRSRSCTAGIRLLHKLAPKSSKCNSSRKRILKKISGCRKLDPTSSMMTSLKRSNYVSRIRHRRRPVCQISSKQSRKQSKSLSKLLLRRAECCTKVHSKLTECSCEPESLTASVDQNMCSVPLDLSPKNALPDDLLPCEDFLEDCVSSDSNTVALSPQPSVGDLNSVDQVLIPCKNALQTDLLPDDLVFNERLPEDCSLSADLLPREDFLEDCVSSDSNTVVLSPEPSVDELNSVDQVLIPCKNALQTNLLPDDLVFNERLPEDCSLSDSNTVMLSPHSSMDDLTIVYRSPLSGVFDFDESSLDQQEMFEGNAEACIGSGKLEPTAVDSGQQLKPPSYPDYSMLTHDALTLWPYAVDESSEQDSEPIQLPRNSTGSCTFSKSLSPGLVTSNTVDNDILRPTPVQLIGSTNGGLEKQCSLNSLSEFMDKDMKRGEIAASVSTEVISESSRTGAEEG